MLYVAFLTVYEHYVLDEATVKAVVENNPEMLPSANNTTESVINHKKSVQWFEPLAIVPVLCFAYQTHEVIVPVYACMQQRSIGHFMKASIFGLVILFFLYNLVGAYGYLTFGANVGADIMSLYDAKDPVVVVGVVALVIKFITTYPPLMFCGRGAFDGLYGEFRKLSNEEFKSSEKTRRIVITTAWFFSTVALAVFAPDISVTLQLLGSMASINVFVFPGMCLVSLTRRLRRARLALLADESAQDSTNQQRAKDFYLISGSHFEALKKSATESLANHHHHQHQAMLNGNKLSLSNRQHFAATFASLIEIENSNGMRNGEKSTPQNRPTKINGYGTHSRHNPRKHDEYERHVTNGSYSAHDQFGPFGINDSIEDYSDCENRIQNCDKINPIVVANNGYANNTSCVCSKLASDMEFNTSYNNKDPSLDRSAGFTNVNQLQCLQNSWNNKSTTGSILDRLGSSIAPTTVALIGISRLAAIGLYLFSAILITFGIFIFVLELVTVFGLL